LQTHHSEPEEAEQPVNTITRSAHAKHPFSVLRDDNPRGFEWLTKIMQTS
jgi:hypothetical protein